MKIRTILAVVLYLSHLISHAQGDPTQQASNILPPSPTASELGKYGLNPTGLSTGSANVSIPVYNYAAGRLSLPISLNYNSNGLKVDQLASWIGLNWSMNAGGAISRIIRDEADDDVLYNPPPYPTTHNPKDPEYITYLQTAGNNSTFDSERDLYTFNFLQYTGKFVFDRAGNVLIMPFQNIKIERFIDGDQSYFRVTTPDGIIYTFNFQEYSRSAPMGAGCGRNYDGFLVSSWFLTKIQHPSGDIINLEYSPSGYSYPASVSQTIMAKLGQNGSCSTGSCLDYSDKLCLSNMSISGGYLKKIWSPQYGCVNFTATQTRTDVNDYKLDKIEVNNNDGTLIKAFGFGYTFSTSQAYANTFTLEALKHRMFLTSFEERDNNSATIKTHTFEYNDIDNLPPRLSFAQDFWGYFNGASENTQYLVPKDPIYASLFGTKGGNRNPNSQYAQKGLLSKVSFPTGGISTYTYSPNTYWGTHTVYPSKKVPISLVATGVEDRFPGSQTMTIDNNMDQSVSFMIMIDLNQGFTQDQIDKLHDFAMFTVTDQTNHLTIHSSRIDFANPASGSVSNSKTELVNLISGHSYTLTMTAYAEISYGHVLGNYYDVSSHQETTNLVTGGVRVSQVTDYDPITKKTEYTNYTYANHASPNVSSGVMGPGPAYYQPSTVRMTCQGTSNGTGTLSCDTYDCRYASLSSNSLNSLYPMGGNNIYYKYVLVSKGNNFENGAEEHEFMIQFDVPGQTIWGDNILTSSYTNLNWGNGEETAVRIFKKNSNTWIPVHELLNNYVADTRNQHSLSNIIVRKKYDAVCSSDAVVTCDASNVNKVYSSYVCTANHSHKYLIGGWPWGNGESSCTAVGANNHWEVYGTHPCYQQPIGATVTVPSQLDNLDAVEYQNIAFWHYLQSTTENTFDINGANPVSVIKEYRYDNPKHGFLTNVKTSTVAGLLEETALWYPQDYDVTENLQTLRDKSILNTPIKTEHYRDGLQTSGTVIKLTDVGLPKEYYSFESSQPETPLAHSPTTLVPSPDYNLKASLTYDAATNNLIEFNSTKDPKVTYLWGYNNTKPMAEVKGASVNDIAYTSFEQTSTGNWTFTGTPVVDVTAPTGVYTYNLSSGNLHSTSLNSSTVYVLSYFYKAGSTITISGGTSSDVINTNYKDGWMFTQRKITGASSLILSGTGSLDEVRLLPYGAQMTTLTYKENVGVTSMTDPNNITTFYDYDSMGRLISISDHYRKVRKSNRYVYYQK